jgi:ubiquinone/menaquinone biosynthesis C-methylase UbiE
MELSPRLYRWFVRPKWISNLCIRNVVNSNFNFENKKVLDFGCGVGSICFMFQPSNYMGIDCDSRRIDYAKRLNPGYNFDVLKGNEISVEDKSIDYILTISVLHHIPSEYMKNFAEEFNRVLKCDGKIIVIEPCFLKDNHFNNRFMSFFDKGKYIRSEEEYLSLFNDFYETEVLKKYNQLMFYNKLFFTATPKSFH